jgi:hypothetical protein
LALPRLCKAGQQLRAQIDDDYADRDRRSDGWIADARHVAKGNSDHIPDARGIVRALDIDADLAAHKEEAYALVEKIRKCAKQGDKRIKYIIYDGKIMSPILNWKRRPYKGANPHRSHFHISFTTLGDNDGKWFDLEGDNNAGIEKDGGNVGEDFSRDGSINVPLSRTSTRLHSQCGTCECVAFRN